MNAVLEKCSDNSRSRIPAYQKNCKNKKLTKAGLERKERIVAALFYNRLVMDLHCNLYIHVRPLIKSFVLIFQQKEPMVHRLFDELKSCMQSFLGCFIKIENITSLTAKQLSKVKVADTSLHKPFKYWSIDRRCLKLMKKVNEDDRQRFKLAVCEAFASAAQYMQ